jgi:hypothetical protein
MWTAAPRGAADASKRPVRAPTRSIKSVPSSLNSAAASRARSAAGSARRSHNRGRITPASPRPPVPEQTTCRTVPTASRLVNPTDQSPGEKVGAVNPWLTIAAPRMAPPAPPATLATDRCRSVNHGQTGGENGREKGRPQRARRSADPAGGHPHRTRTSEPVHQGHVPAGRAEPEAATSPRSGCSVGRGGKSK